MKSISKLLGVSIFVTSLSLVALPAVSQEGAAASPATEEEGEAPAPSRFRRPVVTDTLKWSPAEEQDVSLIYSNQLMVTEPDYASVDAAKPGDVIALTQCAAPKLKTDVDLKFGDTVIEQGNVAEDYPGVYSLWLKKTEAGWNLVFNWKADVWGTMHDPAADVAEVVLNYEHRESEAKEIATLLLAEEGDEKPKNVPRFKGEWIEEGGAVQFRMEWGPHHWVTSFTGV